MKGVVVDLQPALNASGRVKVLNVIGTKGTLTMPGADVRRRLGLRSTWFSVGVLSLTAPPQPVTYGGRGQTTRVARGPTQAGAAKTRGGQGEDGGWTDSRTVGAAHLPHSATLTAA